jgi:O-antigen/teichoic acid export membrane protein
MSISPSELNNLTAGKRLLRNSVLNLLGDGAPFIVALVAIPRLVHALGTERFGMLTLVWMVIGYFSVFDLGLGRALTNLVAKHLGRGEDSKLGPLVWTAIILMLALGTAGALLLAGLSHWIVYSALKIPPELRVEALHTFYLFSLSIPAVITTTAFRGVLEAHQHFSIAIAIRMPMSIYSFAAPLVVLPFSHSLVPVVAVLVAGRFLGFALHAAVCIAKFPWLHPLLQWNLTVVRPLMSFGGWMTVSNIISPMMAELDRVLVGAIVSLQAVAFYATPYDLITKLTIIPGALAGVFFPAFSTAIVSDPVRTRKLYLRSLRLLALTMAPITLVIVLVAHPGLRLWLGPEFSLRSAPVLQMLAVGIFFNSIAYIPFALIQGAGRADWTAKLHLVELPFYLATFWLLTTHFSIVGTAMAWCIRAAVDFAALIILGGKLMESYRRASPRYSAVHAVAQETLRSSE